VQFDERPKQSREADERLTDSESESDGKRMALESAVRDPFVEHRVVVEKPRSSVLPRLNSTGR
jgi:hypothetical protein